MTEVVVGKLENVLMEVFVLGDHEPVANEKEAMLEQDFYF